MRPRPVLVALLGAALVCALAGGAPFGGTAGAAGVAAGAGAGAGSPLAGLEQARSVLGALAGQTQSANARRSLTVAEGELGAAVVPALWIDGGQPVAPPYGVSVFAHSRAALAALEQVPSSGAPAGAVAGVETSVLAADRNLALAALRQAVAGPGGLLARAKGMILSGDRWAETSRVDFGAVQYGAAWRDAFGALIEVVELRALLVSPAAIGAGAENALGRRSIAPAGVRALAGRGGLSRSGLPDVLFVGTESCRFCATERWGLIAALSQFGRFSNLHLSQSATTQRPIVRSFTFHGSSYRSLYVSFDPVELTSDVPRPGGGYQPEDRLTSGQRQLMRALDPAGTAPFVDVANQFADVGATVPPDALSGLPWGALSASFSRPKTASGQAIAATAEVLTAEICHATGGAPAAVCGASAVQDYATRLARFGGPGGGCPVMLGVARRVVAPSRRPAVSAASRLLIGPARS